MKPDDLDRWLSGDDPIVPSSGFSASVMEAIRREASNRQAMPFPWKRALPGIVMMAVALATVLWSGLRLDEPATAATPDAVFRSLAALGDGAILWTAIVTVMTVVLVVSSISWTRARY